MSNEDLIGQTKGVLAKYGRIQAIKYVRSFGLAFSTSRQMVMELMDDAPWYRKIKAK